MRNHEHFVHLGQTGVERMLRHQHDQEVFHTLLRDHDRLRREVENLPNGIRSVTTSDDPGLVQLLHDHVPAMHRRLLDNMGLRFWDPAFREIFAQREKIQMKISLLPDGVLLEETSDDPNVVPLIQAHGEVVNAFVREGIAAFHRKTPLPPGYQPVGS